MAPTKWRDGILISTNCREVKKWNVKKSGGISSSRMPLTSTTGYIIIDHTMIEDTAWFIKVRLSI